MSDVDLFESDEDLSRDLSNEDVVLETPPKIFRKKRNLKQSKDHSQYLTDKESNETIYDINTIHRCPDNINFQNCNTNERNKLKSLLNIYHNIPSNIELDTIISTVHVYRTINEIVDIYKNDSFVYNNVKITGKYGFGKLSKKDILKAHYLKDGHTNEKLELNLNCQKEFPASHSLVLVYGTICTKQTKISDEFVTIPFINVKFWKNLLRLDVYERSFKLEKMFRPKQLDMILTQSNFLEDTLFDCSDHFNTQDIFDTIDSSYLIKIVEKEEQFYSELEQLMSIENDIFE